MDWWSKYFASVDKLIMVRCSISKIFLNYNIVSIILDWSNNFLTHKYNLPNSNIYTQLCRIIIVYFQFNLQFLHGILSFSGYRIARTKIAKTITAPAVKVRGNWHFQVRIRKLNFIEILWKQWHMRLKQSEEVQRLLKRTPKIKEEWL